LATGLTPWIRSRHGPSAHSVPATARATSASGHRQTGLASSRTNARVSSVGNSGISDTSQSPINQATAVVDHGSAMAVSTASRSASRNHAATPCREATAAAGMAMVGGLSAVSVMIAGWSVWKARNLQAG